MSETSKADKTTEKQRDTGFSLRRFIRLIIYTVLIVTVGLPVVGSIIMWVLIELGL